MERFINNEQETLTLGDRLAHGVHHGGIIYLSGDTGSGKTTLMTGILHGLGVLVSKSRFGHALLTTLNASGMTVHCINFYGVTDADSPDLAKALACLREEGTLRIVECPERAHAELPSADLHIKFRPGLKGRTISLNALSDTGSAIARHINPHH